MKGVHCQTAMAIMPGLGATASTSKRPSPSEVVTQLNRPKTGLSSMFFQTTALTVGMTKNGAISSERTSPRSGNVRCSSRARPRPSTSAGPTMPTVIRTEFTIAMRKVGSWITVYT